MPPRDMWDLNPVFATSYWESYLDMLDVRIGMVSEDREDESEIPREGELQWEDEEDMDVVQAQEEGFECEEVLSSDDEDDGYTIEDLLLYQDICAAVNGLPPVGSLTNPIDLTYY